MPVRYPALCKVVRRKLDVYAIAHQDADAISSHATRDRRGHNVLAILYLDLKERVWLLIDHDSG